MLLIGHKSRAICGRYNIIHEQEHGLDGPWDSRVV